ncbi:MAG: FkbM family methyltransferase [Actinomycetota bacterium]|nr:FkbM family methyltransferase [Actinomycetota bacterium]
MSRKFAVVSVGNHKFYMIRPTIPDGEPYLRSPKESFTVDWFLACSAQAGPIWDIGANVGEFTLLAAKASGDPSRLVAFEPNPYVRKALVANIRQNGFEDQVLVVPKAVGSQPGIAQLFVGSHESYYGKARVASTKARTKANDQIVEVPITTVDEMVASGLPAPRYLKIDVEGHEVEVLRGASATLKGVESCLIEVAGANVLEIRELLGRHGFTDVTVDAQRISKTSGDVRSEYITVRR